MKKLMVLFLVFIMIFTLAACGEKREGGSQAQGSAPTEASNAPSGEGEKGKAGLSLDDVAGTYSMNTYYDGKEQKHTVVFTKSGDKLVASSDAKGEEPFELSYDQASGTASYVQKIPHEDSEITIDSKYTFILEDGGTKVNGETTMLFKDETKDGPRYEGYKID
jgi:uncharacterized lipoprotein YehR (DUF1307 family)